MEDELLSELSGILSRKLFAAFPEWRKYAEIVDADYDINRKSLYLKIPSPADERHSLSILERGDCIEVGFSDGNPMTAAESQIICERNNDSLCVEAAIEFVEKIINEEILIGHKRASWLSGNKLLSFINRAEANKKKFARIYSWRGNFNNSISQLKFYS
ncbi:MAG: hypothetical protein M3384_02355 [Acidobacteriota bacterium]|nr:hypothetical protein [Acidobacteriota bacterium]